MRQHINLLLLAGLQTVHTHPAEPLTNCFNLLISSAIWTGPATAKSVNWQMALPDSDVAIISVIKSKNAVACSHAFHGLLKKHFQKKMLQLQIITAALLSLPFFWGHLDVHHQHDHDCPCESQSLEVERVCLCVCLHTVYEHRFIILLFVVEPCEDID